MGRDMAVSGITMPPVLRVDGGMTVNAWLMQRLADILNQRVEVAQNAETTALGAAYHAGQAAGFFGPCEELEKAWRPAKVFEPKMSNTEREARYGGWLEAVARVKSKAAG
jgi:glycerol kinase